MLMQTKNFLLCLSITNKVDIFILEFDETWHNILKIGLKGTRLKEGIVL